MTCRDNILLPARIGGKNLKQVEDDTAKLSEILGVNHCLSKYPFEISGGEQQRIAVARALINQPAFIFADEPSGNLDTENAHALHELFFELRAEMKQSFVIVTHNETFAQMADRSLTMKDGYFI